MRFRDHLSQAWRELRRAPRFSISSVVLFAAGTAAAVTFFVALYALVLKPLPFPEPSRLVVVNAPAFNGYKQNIPGRAGLAPIFASIAAYHQGDAGVSVGGGSAVPLAVTGVTPEFFKTMGTAPVYSGSASLGNRDAVISEGLGRSWFGHSKRAIGAAIDLDGLEYRIRGIMPAGFDFPGHTQVWVAIASPLGCGGCGGVTVLGRLRTGLSLKQAAAGLKAATAHASQELERRPGPALIPLHRFLLGPRQTLLRSLFGGAFLFFLLACAGVINLCLAHDAAGEHGLAVRVALGATSARLHRELLVRNLILALVGSLLGGVVAWPASRLLLRFLPPTTGGQAPPVAFAAAACALALAIGAALLCSALGTRRAPGPPLGTSLSRGAGHAATGARGRLLLASQLVITLILLTGTGLLARSMANVLTMKLGFHPQGVFTISTSFGATPAQRRAGAGLKNARTRAQRQQVFETMFKAEQAAAALHLEFYRQARARLAALPGVLRVGAFAPPPFSGPNGGAVVYPAKPNQRNQKLAVNVNFHYASAAGLQALAIPILSGRPWHAEARLPSLMAGANKSRGAGEAAQAPVLVSQTLARELWPGQSATGKTLWLPYGGGAVEVIGVVGDIRESSRRGAPVPTVYASVLQGIALRQLTFVVQARAGMKATVLAPMARAAMESLPFEIVRPKVASLQAAVDSGTRQLRIALWAISCFAILALLVGGLGVYASARQISSARTREVGIRLALGADRAGVIRLLLVRNLKVLAIALPAGSIGALILAHVLQHWLFRVGAASLAIYAGAWVILIAVALAAAIGPALRGARRNPADLLHDE